MFLVFVPDIQGGYLDSTLPRQVHHNEAQSPEFLHSEHSGNTICATPKIKF